MKYYFTLQFIRLKRWFEETGIIPLLGIIIAIVMFVLLSKYLFFKTEFAKWIYPLLALSTILKLGEKRRNDQLKIIFNRTNRLKIRILENTIIALPFLFYLLYEQQYIFVIGLLILSILLALFDIDKKLNRVIPTPFRKFPFENIVGFRKSFLLIGMVYFLIFKAIQVGNYNLGIVSFGALFFILMSFYSKPEQNYFVWIFADKAIAFLKRKLVNAIICAIILTTPALLGLFVFFPDRFITSMVISLIGAVFLISMIFAKYSAYPNEMNLPQGILYALSLWFPPMLIIVILIFYKQSKKNLEPILE